jgi:uncharacterized protein
VIDFIGMVHLQALPGSPRSRSTLDACLDLALRDADALQVGGVDGLIIENFNDVPFRAGRVDAFTVAAMTHICLKVREQVDCKLGINVLRNDADAALAIAAATGADFVRINIHTGAMLTDQGVITGRADETLRTRRTLGAEHIRIFADVLVKHAIPLGPLRIEDAVEDAILRGLADAVVVTGTATGKSALREEVREAARAAGGVPVYVGSGVSAENVAELVPPAQGLIAGSWLKIDGDVRNAVDVTRVRRLRTELTSIQATSSLNNVPRRT